MNTRQRGYVETAARFGFVVSIVRQQKKATRVHFTCPSGIEFDTHMPTSPSHSRGPRNWVQNLRRIEAGRRTAKFPLSHANFPAP